MLDVFIISSETLVKNGFLLTDSFRWATSALAYEQYFNLFMGGGHRRERGGESRHGFAWVAVFCGMYIVALRGECVLCILSKLQQLRIMDITVMLLGFLNHLPNYPSSFDLPNLLTHSLIIIFIRNDWQ